jgi:hypothetical protein
MNARESGHVDDFLKALARKQCGILLIKANEGFSAVLVNHKEYVADFLLRDHHNGKTAFRAIQKLKESMSKQNGRRKNNRD